jgi:hypothetical protein
MNRVCHLPQFREAVSHENLCATQQPGKMLLRS